LALDTPPAAGDPVRIINQVAETHRLRDLAQLVSDLTGADIECKGDETAENERAVSNATVRNLGLEPILLRDALKTEILDITQRFIERADLNAISATALQVGQGEKGMR
jgi:UDP-sulfoquinovose synthase